MGIDGSGETRRRGTGLGERLKAFLKRDRYRRVRPRRGEVYEATILSIGEHDMVVDLGAKRDGIILPRDLENESRAAPLRRRHFPAFLFQAHIR